MSFCWMAMTADSKAVNPPIQAMTSSAGAGIRAGRRRGRACNTPAATIVAAWISALTGVGPSMASGSQTCSGNCALLPIAPQKISKPATVASVPSACGLAARFAWSTSKLSEPRLAQTSQDAEQEPEVAQAIGDEGLLARIRRRGPLEPEADEQVAGHADQFPEDEQLHEVVRQHDAEHREGEQAQAGEVARQAAVLASCSPRNRYGSRSPRRSRAAASAGSAGRSAGRSPPGSRRSLSQVAEDSRTAGSQPTSGTEDDAQDEAGDDRADGKGRAELAVALREQRDQHRREQRQEQDDPG